MTTRERLHRIFDALPDAEADALARVADAMAAGVLDPAARAALLAPDDDELETEEERAAVAASYADLAAGRVVSLAALRAEWAAEEAGGPATAGAAVEASTEAAAGDAVA